MPIIAPVEITKNKEFYMDKGEIKTREADLVRARDEVKEIPLCSPPVPFICWECEPKNPDALVWFEYVRGPWTLLCKKCGKWFYKLIDVTDYKKVIK